MARRMVIAGLMLAATAIVAAPAHAAGERIRVEGIKVEPTKTGATVTATVAWIDSGTDAARITQGDLRLVAVTEQGHLPTVLATKRQDLTSGSRTRDVELTVDADGLAAMGTGNRVVLTASQHPPYTGLLTQPTYVKVGQVQAYGSPQPHIGTDDCSATPIQPGAKLQYCDLTGAYLDHAKVSQHDLTGGSARMERADLTGATLQDAFLSGASLAGGRANGADMRRANLDNLSLAGAEATELNAAGAQSDQDSKDTAANFFGTKLTGADLSNTHFNGVSIDHARLNGVKATDAVWIALDGQAATFRDANLSRTQLPQANLDFADFTNAKLRQTTGITDGTLQWSYLCNTTLPSGSTADPQRDCRSAVEAPTKPIDNPERATPYVAVTDASLGDGPGARTVKAKITWDAQSAGTRQMRLGDLRLVAIDGTTGVPTVLRKLPVADVSTPTVIGPSATDITISDPDKLAAMRPGNRVVLTATQHQAFATGGGHTTISYVTVATLQKGPGRGRVGRFDCSRVALDADSVRPLDSCDLAGATLTTADLHTRSMRFADLTGSAFQRGSLDAVLLDGAALGGLDADTADLTDVTAVTAWAPQLSMPNGTLDNSIMRARNLNDADFSGTTISGTRVATTTTFATAPLRRALFTGADIVHEDFALADLAGADFRDVTAEDHTSLFLANLTRADMSGSNWDPTDEEGLIPWMWSTLCETQMPESPTGISGDRDCPR